MSRAPAIRQRTCCIICSKSVLVEAAMKLYDTLPDTSCITIALALEQFANIKLTSHSSVEKYVICRKECIQRLIDAIEFQEHIKNTFADPTQSCLKSPDHEAIIPHSVPAIASWDSSLPIDSAFQVSPMTKDTPNHVVHDSLTFIDTSPVEQLQNIGRPFVFPELTFVKTHMKFKNLEYVELNGHMCCGCDFIAKDVEELMNHVAGYHSNFTSNSEHLSATGLYLCEMCSETFDDDYQLLIHKEWFQHTEIFLCKLCLYGFVSKERLTMHMTTCVEHMHYFPKTKEIPDLTCETIATENQQHHEPLGIYMDSSVAKKYIAVAEKVDRKVIADRYITRVEDYDDYKILHTEAKRCCSCAMFFADFAEIKVHAQFAHHTLNPLRSKGANYCQLCGEIFRTKKALRQHQTFKNNNTQVFYCKICEMYFLRMHQLARHLLTSLKHCNDGVEFVSEKRHNAKLAVLLRNQRVTKPRAYEGYGCCFLRCNATFDDENDLQNHVEEQHAVRRRIHESEQTSNKHVCETCKQSFSNPKTLHRHRYMWQLKKDNMCSYCGNGFTTRAALKQHEQLQHTDSAPQFECEFCGKRFKKKSLVKLHLITHQQERRFGCEHCAARFHFGHQLKKHQQAVHTIVFPYECKYCDRKMVDKNRYDLHMRTHTGEKPYKCRHECDRMFSHTTDRRRHEMSAHTGEKPHRCLVCKNAYVRKRELQLHFQKHPSHNVEEEPTRENVQFLTAETSQG